MLSEIETVKTEKTESYLQNMADAIDPLCVPDIPLRQKKMLELQKRLGRLGYFDAPASKSHHLARRGGLVAHSTNVTQSLLGLMAAWGIKWPRPESPYIVGMLHDLVKCRCYRAVHGAAQDGVATGGAAQDSGEVGKPRWEYVQPEYPGHGACSVMIAQEIGLRLMREEIAAITFHMGPWGIGKEYTEAEFRAAMDAFAPYIIATHSADWYAAEVDEKNERNGK